jgi:competence ComEA-like helix-hairpin-helix protein
MLWASIVLILLAGCGSAAHPIVIETPVASATLYVTPEPTVRPTHTPAPTRTPRATSSTSRAVTIVGTLAPESRININTADADTLARLPHIGPALAQRIIVYRQEHGPFKRIEDIRDVKGIGDAIFAAIKDAITVE